MKNYKSKNWIKTNFILLFIFIILYISFNYTIDPYGYNNTFNINKINSNKTQTEAQSRKFKLRLAEQTDFNGLFLGSSEMTFLGNTEYISKLTNTQFFNLAFNEQEIYESYEYLKYIISIKKIKHVVLGLHPFKFNKLNDNYRQDIPINIINHVGDIETYLSYNIFIDSLKTIYKNYTKYPIITNKFGWKVVDIFKYNKIPKDEQNNWIKQKINESPNILKKEAKQFILDLNKLEYFYKIVNLCKESNIQLQVLFTPIYYKHFISIYKNMTKDMDKLKYLIAQETSFYDFSTINTITLNHMNFIDRVSHCNQNVSYPIIDTLINNIYYKDFGTFITQQNIESFINDSHINLNKYQILLKNP